MVTCSLYFLPLADIDECKDANLNDCIENSSCRNNFGSYNCTCPQGYDGDGRKDRLGCHRSLSNSNKINSRNILVVGFGVGTVALCLVVACFLLCKVAKRRRKMKIKEKYFKRNGGLLLRQQLSTDRDASLEKTKLFTSDELEKATDHFNESRILGQGGQGTVYKGMLSDGRIVAIKKSKLIDENQLEQFINEVVILSQINHRNVVKLLGCCLETQVPLLVYEFVPNGTLYSLIHSETDELPLTWEMRLRIAAEIAGALAYLHSASSVPIFHRDIKSSNILLDEKYRTKVSDFGTSRTISTDQTHLTTLVKGTFGYLDPEYFQSSQFTEKSDVYSFGVVLIELLTGLKPIPSTSDDERSLVARFLASTEENHLSEILDPRVLRQAKKKDLSSISSLGRRCLNLNGKRRPTMKEVALELEGIRTSMKNSSFGTTFQEGRSSEIELIEISETSYAWTSMNSSSSCTLDGHPLLFNTV